MIPPPSRIAGRAAHEDGAHPGLDAHLHGPGAFLRHPWVEPLAANSSAGWANQRGLTDFPRRVFVGLWRLVGGGVWPEKNNAGGCLLLGAGFPAPGYRLGKGPA